LPVISLFITSIAIEVLDDALLFCFTINFNEALSFCAVGTKIFSKDFKSTGLTADSKKVFKAK
jgi:hypothetical protein